MIILKKTISQTFLERVRVNPEQVGFQFKPTYSEMGTVGQWKTYTFKEFYNSCRLISFGLMGVGVQPGDRVVIQSSTRIEWSLADIAVLGAKAVTVPIYASNTPEDAIYMIEHSEARVIFAEDSRQLQKLLNFKLKHPDSMAKVEKIIVFDSSAMQGLTHYGEHAKKVLTLQALMQLGKRAEARKPLQFDENLSSAQPFELVTICYTSGTTGVPKGAMLTHDNIMSVIEDDVSIMAPYFEEDKEVVLSFLPFSHIIGKIECSLVFVKGWRQVFAESMDRLMANMVEVRPTFLFSVPRVFEKAKTKILTKIESKSSTQKKLFFLSFSRARKYYDALANHRQPTLRERSEFYIAKRLVLQRIADGFGGRLKYVFCGGAPLSKDVAEFFQAFGITILEGFGLTETSGPVTFNRPEDYRFGLVGKPLPEVTIKIADDGEILIQSRKVCQGYYKDPEETAKVFRGPWFYTGDMGYLDQEGFLHITDRKKDIIITSGGKNVAPQKIENLALSFKTINHMVVHGDRRNFLTALLTLDREAVLRHAQEHQILFSEYAELIKHAKVLSWVQKWVDQLNTHLAPFEKIKKFVILPNDFTVEAGELTPSLKVKRKVIGQKFKAELDSMYL